jgi:hypothetical protein
MRMISSNTNSIAYMHCSFYVSVLDSLLRGVDPNQNENEDMAGFVRNDISHGADISHQSPATGI